MFFQGQEFAASSPFLYFADHKAELAEAVARGHAEFLTQFRDLALPEIQARLPDPHDPATFESLQARPRRAAPRAARGGLRSASRPACGSAEHEPGAARARSTGRSSADDALRRSATSKPGGDDRLLLVNLGRALHLDPLPQPLLAPPRAARGDCSGRARPPSTAAAAAPSVEADRRLARPRPRRRPAGPRPRDPGGTRRCLT